MPMVRVDYQPSELSGMKNSGTVCAANLVVWGEGINHRFSKTYRGKSLSAIKNSGGYIIEVLTRKLLQEHLLNASASGTHEGS